MKPKKVTKAKGDANAARSVAFQSSYIARRPYMNEQLMGTLAEISNTFLAAEPWRRVLYSSPTVWACTKALNDQLVALPWRVTTKDKAERHRKRAIIDYYTEEVISQFNGEDYDTGVIRCNRDVLSIPQGGNCEIVRKTSGAWDGEVDRVENIDGGTLTPTSNIHFPLIQRDPNDRRRHVIFSKEQVRRILLNPRPEFNITGYQQSPLEMCYLAIDALAKGDFYYLNFLTDTPSAGILDLKDFTEEEAIEWVHSWKELLTGSEALKIPVLYDHTESIDFVSFGQPPEKMMLDESLARYTKIVHACFGLYTQDTGLSERPSTGGREANLERRSWHRFNAVIAVWENFWNSIIPKDLTFSYEEINIEETERLARAKVANANALGILLRGGVVGQVEARREASEIGLIETYIETETPPDDLLMGGGFGGINPVIPGGSRSTEHRLPEEGRRVALPAPKTPTREEQIDRVRPKALVSLGDALTTTFHNMTESIKEDDLAQLIKDTIPFLIPIIKEAKSFTDTTYPRWLDEFHALNEGGESLLVSKAIVKKQQNAKKVTEDLLKAYNWDNITDEELIAFAIAIFKATYEESLLVFAQEAWQELYTAGLVESPTPDFTPNLTDQFILAELDHYAHRMVSNLEQGNRFYLRSVLTRTVMDNLSKPEIRAQINEGDDIDDIITVALITAIATDFKAAISELTIPRAERATAFELTNIMGAAKLKAMREAGLTTKRWNTFGPDPCPICIGNESLGDVPLDYEYESVFGTTLWALAHPYGYCDISFDKAELYAIIDTGGELTLFTGA